MLQIKINGIDKIEGTQVKSTRYIDSDSEFSDEELNPEPSSLSLDNKLSENKPDKSPSAESSLQGEPAKTFVNFHFFFIYKLCVNFDQ